MFCFSWDNKHTKSKYFASVLKTNRPNQNFCFRSNNKGIKSKPLASIYKFLLHRNVPLCLRQFLDQMKLVRFVPEPMGQNGNKLLLIQKNSDQTKTFCFHSDLKRTKSKRFAFVLIISFEIGAFLLSFRYRWHYYCRLYTVYSVYWPESGSQIHVLQWQHV